MIRRSSLLNLSLVLLAACATAAEGPEQIPGFTNTGSPNFAIDSGVISNVTPGTATGTTSGTVGGTTGTFGGTTSGTSGAPTGATSGSTTGATSGRPTGGASGGTTGGTSGGTTGGTSGGTSGGTTGGTSGGTTAGTNGGTAAGTSGGTAGATSGGTDAGVMGAGDAGPVASRDSGTTDGSTGSSSDGFVRGPAPTAAALTKNGPYQVMSTTRGFRNGPDFAEATLWWPADADPPFASVAVIPGWVSTENDIKEWGPYFASYGIVAMTAGTNSPATDLPPDRAGALLDILTTIRGENTRSGGPLNGKLDLSRLATMGWSMGGGGTLLAAEKTPTLKATISMCGWNPGYSYAKLKVPALMFASLGDPLAGGQSQGFYESIPNSTPKELWEVSGGDHFFFNTPKAMNGIVGRYGLSWLKVYLEGDMRYLQFLKEKPASKTDFRNNLP